MAARKTKYLGWPYTRWSYTYDGRRKSLVFSNDAGLQDEMRVRSAVDAEAVVRYLNRAPRILYSSGGFDLPPSRVWQAMEQGATHHSLWDRAMERLGEVLDQYYTELITSYPPTIYGGPPEDIAALIPEWIGYALVGEKENFVEEIREEWRQWFAGFPEVPRYSVDFLSEFCDDYPVVGSWSSRIEGGRHRHDDLAVKVTTFVEQEKGLIMLRVTVSDGSTWEGVAPR